MSSPIALQELFKAGFDDFAIPVYEDAPFTTIQNRAKVTRSLKAIAGVERVHVKGINRLQNEFGPNGEQVWEADNKDSRVRFVGNWSVDSASNGSYPLAPVGETNNYCEITFYGTGLNLISRTVGGVTNHVVSIDGGADGSNFMPNMSAILTGRNYAANIVISVASNLTLGWHTVRYRKTDTISSISIQGFEVLNQRTDLAVYSGAGIAQGSFTGLSSLTTSSFTEGVTGSRGARVVKYIEDGSLKSAVQLVDATTQYLASANHANEEVVRRINFREFGANRADDFSTLAGVSSSRAFTLDDGTTTLVGVSVTATDSIGFPTSGTSAITLTFIGTGLDILSSTTVAFSGNIPITVDGISAGSITSNSTGIKNQKICSGLPYGTHTVRILVASVTAGDWMLSDFIIYQPKKPSIPAGAFEVADYNVMATYTPALAGLETNSLGVMKKACMREMTYVGAGWSVAALAPANDWNGFGVITATIDNYAEYTFWGTGFDLRFFASTTTSGNVEVRLNGSLLTTTNFPTMTTSVAAPAGVSFTNTTGILDQSVTTGTQPGCLLSVSNLPLGRYTVRLTNKASATMLFNSFDVITPIHISEPALKDGSNSLKSVTKYSPEKSVSNTGPDLSKAKAWVNYDGINQRIISSFNVSAVLKVATGDYIVYFEKPFKSDAFVSMGCSSASQTQVYQSGGGLKQTNIQRFATQSSTGTQADVLSAYLVCFGELIDE